MKDQINGLLRFVSPRLKQLISGMRKREFGLGLILLPGFGMMLLLIVVSGFEAIRITDRIREREALILTRNTDRQRVLSDIRSNLLWASIWAGDYLQSRTPGAEDFYRLQLWGLRQEWRMTLTRQSMLPLNPEQQQIWDDLQHQITEFWNRIDPVLDGNSRQQFARISRFSREQMNSRRTSIMKLTDELSDLNQQVLDNETAGVRQAEILFHKTMGLRIILFLVLGSVIALFSLRYARRLEKKLQAQFQESTLAQGNLQRLSTKMAQAQEDERRAISRELHDQIGQALTAIKVNLGTAEQKMPLMPPEVQERLRESKQLAEQTIQEVRDLSRLLRPTMLDDLGLVPALEWYARSSSRRYKVPVHLQIDSKLGRLPEEWETCLYRSIQEALNNALRHAEATEVSIRIEQSNGQLMLTIEDNGRGLEANSQTGGLGLIGMIERARELGGRLVVESNGKEGTKIRITLPQPPVPAASEEKAGVV